MKKPLTAEDLYELKSVEDPQLSPTGQHLAFVRVEVNRVENKYERHIWLVDLAATTPTPRQFTFGSKSDFEPRWSPDGQQLAFVSTRADKPQLYCINLAGGEARALTKMAHGAGHPVWSADGQRLAFTASVNAEERAREDTGEKDEPLADALAGKHRKERTEQTEKDKVDPRLITRLPYRTGKDYYDDRRSHIYVMDLKDFATEMPKPYRLTDGELDFNAISWSPDGAVIYSTQARDPEHEPWFDQAIVQIAAKGKRKPYRHLSARGHSYSAPQASPDGIWLATTRITNHDSWGQLNRLVLMPRIGGPAVELIPDFDRSIESFQWSPDSHWIYFTVSDRGNVSVYRVGVRERVVEPVIAGTRAVLGFSVNSAGAVAFVAQTPTRPPEVYFATVSQTEQRLTTFNDKWLAERVIAPIEERWHTAPDGRKIQGWLLKPIGFKRGQKYPLVLNMHGGPWVMWGPAMPHIWLEWQLHAARGYAVYFCNPRGSDGYGQEFSLSIRNDWGNHVMHDILSGLDAVVAQGFVDTKHMAVTGGSYAGYMTAWIIGHDQRFACAWAQRGLYNLTSFFGTSDVPQLIEREFETLGFDDVEKLWKQSPLAYVRDMHTPLVIEHQDNDWRCPPSEAEQLYTALKRLKREVVLLRYPGEGHEMSRGGEPRHRVDRLNRMVEWFDKYCQPRRKARK